MFLGISSEMAAKKHVFYNVNYLKMVAQYSLYKGFIFSKKFTLHGM